jgi:hypothetical protein
MKNMESIVKFFVALITALAVFSLINQYDSLLELPNNFLPFWFLVIILNGVLAFYLKKRKSLFLLSLAFLIHLFFFFRT